MIKTKADLEDELNERDRRIADLRFERDEARDLIQRRDEQLQDVDELLETWKQGFDMSLDGDGNWSFPEFVKTSEN
jgi:hypothetical protein